MKIIAEPPSCLAVGHVTHDRFDGRLVPGGCAYYAAKTWFELGAQARLATALGEDFECDSQLDDLEVFRSLGMGEDESSSTVFTNLYPDDGPRIQFVEAVASRVRPDGLEEDWRRPDVMFLGPVLGEVDIAAWKSQVAPRLLAVGVQGYVRGARELDADGVIRRRVVPEIWSPDRELLEGVDVVCLSDEDLVGQDDLLDRLIESVPLVALTRERAGCEIIESGNKTWVGIHPAKVVDPTGAGDTFAAGLLFGLAGGMTTIESARLGAAAASIIIEGKGGSSFTRLSEAFERAEHIS